MPTGSRQLIEESISNMSHYIMQGQGTYNTIRTAIWMVPRLQMPPHKKITLLCFLDCAEDERGRNCSPSREMIAKFVGKSLRAMDYDIAWLIERNYLIANGLNIHKSRYNIGLEALGIIERAAPPAIPKPIADRNAEKTRWLEEYERDMQDGAHINGARTALAEKYQQEILVKEGKHT